ncbi:hypothetical protein LCGC14_1917900 [marine sediment metagenome]|uniref:Uncharacterized protein n=1 Tax=marine sediment metagenome TaxID=412755 RepID=A0A0F9FSD8_9ZZZZ
MIDLEKTEIWKKLVDKVTELDARMERIENNIDYARFDIQEQRIDKLERKIKTVIEEKTYDIRFNKIYSRIEKIEGFVYNQSDDKWAEIAKIEDVLRELLDLFGACEFEGQTHEKDLTYEQKYDKLQELWTKLGGEIEQYGRKDGSPSLSVKPTDASKPPSTLVLDPFGVDFIHDGKNPSEQDGTDDSKVYHEDQRTSARQTERPCEDCEEHDICVYKFKDLTDYCPNRLDIPYPGKNPLEQDGSARQTEKRDPFEVIVPKDYWESAREEEKEQTRQTENIKIWEVDPEKLKDVQENYTLVANEDLEWWARDTRGAIHDSIKKYLEEDHE